MLHEGNMNSEHGKIVLKQLLPDRIVGALLKEIDDDVALKVCN
jgi:hypothetical protein